MARMRCLLLPLLALLTACASEGVPFAPALPPEPKVYASKAPAELAEERWEERPAFSPWGQVYVPVGAGEEEVPQVKSKLRQNERVSPTLCRLHLDLRAERVPPQAIVHGLRYAVFPARPFPDSMEEPDFDELERSLAEDPPLAQGFLRPGRAEAKRTGLRVRFETQVEVPCLARDPLPSYRVSFLLLTDRGIRRAIWGISGGGPHREAPEESSECEKER